MNKTDRAILAIVAGLVVLFYVSKPRGRAEGCPWGGCK